MFGNAPQVSFAAAGYGEFDGRARPYESEGSLSRRTYGGSSDLDEPQHANCAMMSGGLPSPSIKSISYGMAGLRNSSDAKMVQALYGEGSGPNKRPHVEEPQAELGPARLVSQQPVDPSRVSSQDTLQGSQPNPQAQPSQLPQQRLPQLPQQPVPSPFFPQAVPQPSQPAMQAPQLP